MSLTSKRGTIGASLLLACTVRVVADPGPPPFPGSPWAAGNSAAVARAAALLAQMNLTEKLNMVHGWSGDYVGNTPGNARLGIPSINLEDGPQGVADRVTGVTAWPSALTVAQAWDRQLMYEFGKGMAQEQYGKGTNVMLGPGVNLARIPWGGRNFEYLGEDPFLASQLVAAEVAGIQSQNISGCVKHFVHNEQEYDRHNMSSFVDRRTHWQTYMLPFCAAVTAGVGSAMCSYNLVNGTYACENAGMLQDLKEPTFGCGFSGWVMSDWGATHSTMPAALAGLDQEMPKDVYFGAALAAAVGNGTVPASRIDDMLMRMLTPMVALGLLDNPPPPTRNITANVTSDGHNALARKLAEESIVLLKNDASFLPWPLTGLSSIAVLGDDVTVAGGGSGGVIPPYVITPQQGIQAVVGPAVTVSYANGTDINAAVALARAASAAVVVVATSSHEGADRTNLSLPVYQDELVAAVLAAQPRTAVVVRCPGACLMPWRDSAPAILFQMMPGQEAGNALASALFGLVNPSGKLPLSFPSSMNDTWLSLPTVPGPVNPVSWPGGNYSEGMFFGYRWYDSRPDLTPLYPFGHGLSYTAFQYTNPVVSGAVSFSGTAAITVTLTNTGSVDGSEVAQLYVSFPVGPEGDRYGEPPQRLVGFQKVHILAGASQQVTFVLDYTSVYVWWPVNQFWVTIPGLYNFTVGSSSRDPRVSGTFYVTN